MLKKHVLVTVLFTLFIACMIYPVWAQVGFDKYGYNYKARIFVGIGENWYRGKYRIDLEPYPNDASDPTFYWDATYGLDRLVMKWSKAWDDARFHGGEWTAEAWCTNEWNGMAGGSGETWHYTTVWVGSELESSVYWREGGYAIWGEFEVILSHGTVAGEHFWEAHTTPAGMHLAL